jgi:Na+/H+-dicarboxylate symporter
MNILFNMSFQTLCLVSFYVLFASEFNIYTHQVFYTISIFIKDTLIWLMPFTVAVFIASTIDSFKKRAPLFIFILLLFEVFSNTLSVSYGYTVGNLVSSYISNLDIAGSKEKLITLWHIPMTKPNWWGADKGSIVGVTLGLISGFFGFNYLKQILYSSRNIMEFILTKIFAKFIPLFILGFVAQMYVTGILSYMLIHYSVLMLYLLVSIILYLFLIFYVSNVFNIENTINNIKNLLPAGAISFTSGCSLSTMPWTIVNTAKNLKDPSLAKAIIPATTNIQQIGDCIVNSFLCFLIYRNFFGYNPDIITWLKFTLVFVAVRFSTVAMIGGAIFLMIPVYQHYLNFNDEMIAMIIAFNVILDPIVTSSNVLANGGLAKIFEMVWNRISKDNDL